MDSWCLIFPVNANRTINGITVLIIWFKTSILYTNEFVVGDAFA